MLSIPAFAVRIADSEAKDINDTINIVASCLFIVTPFRSGLLSATEPYI